MPPESCLASLSSCLFFFFSVLFSTVITLPREERAGLCASRAFVYSFYKQPFLSFFSSFCEKHPFLFKALVKTTPCFTFLIL